MIDAKHPDEAPCSNIGAERKAPEPCTIVIFGASGDLTRRKLIPALYSLTQERLLPTSMAVVGFARRESSDADFRAQLRVGCDSHARRRPVEDQAWQSFEAGISYHQGNFDDPESYAR